MAFKKAEKINARARIALVGVPGGGKSYTMLKLARLLAGPTGKIACIDTEHGSLSKYAAKPGEAADQKNTFEFDVDEASSYTDTYFLEQLTFAEKNGYAVFCCDSYAHFWSGKDGALEFVDKVNAASSFKMEGWNKWRPRERAMVDRMIASPCHVIVTIRTKNDTVITQENGKSVPKKLGLKPVQTEGIEYEFDFVGTLDASNTLVVDKSRCPWYRESEANGVCNKPGYKYFKPFVEWLGAVVPEPIEQPTQQPAPERSTPEAPAAAASAGSGGGAETTSAPVAAVTPNSGIEVPAEVQVLWNRMGTKPALILEVLTELYEQLEALMGEAADEEYIRIETEYAGGRGLAVKKVSFARRVALEMWKRIQQLKAPVQPVHPQDVLFEKGKELVYAD